MTDSILAIETATNACSVALRVGDDEFSRCETGNNVHSQVLLPMIESVLAEAGIAAGDLNAIGVGQGPGSFTGLRIGIGVAQGLAYGANCPMLGVSSLEALAVQAKRHNPQANSVYVGIDARMNEVYCAEFEFVHGKLICLQAANVLAPELLRVKRSDSLLAGNAWAQYWSSLDSSLQDKSKPLENYELPHASAVMSLALDKFARGEIVDPKNFQPDYIRNNVAKKSSR